MAYINKFNDNAAMQAAVQNGELKNPYVAYTESNSTLHYNDYEFGNAKLLDNTVGAVYDRTTYIQIRGSAYWTVSGESIATISASAGSGTGLVELSYPEYMETVDRHETFVISFAAEQGGEVKYTQSLTVTQKGNDE